MLFVYVYIWQCFFMLFLVYDLCKVEVFLKGFGGWIIGGEIIIMNGGNVVDYIVFVNG